MMAPGARAVRMTPRGRDEREELPWAILYPPGSPNILVLPNCAQPQAHQGLCLCSQLPRVLCGSYLHAWNSSR